MSVRTLPAWLAARFLDRLNVRVVGWRLAQDPGRTVASRTARQADMRGLRRVRRERCAGVDAEVWSAGAGDWVATRLLPRRLQGAAPALVLLHGWLATPLHIDYLAWRMRPLLAAGIEVWLPRLPAHIERTPRGAVSGSRCLLPDALASAAAVRAAAAETNALGSWLSRRHPRVALWGISLGGWVAGVAVSGSGEWCGLVLWSPVVDPVSTMMSSPLAAAAGAGAASTLTDSVLERVRDVVPLDLMPAAPDLAVLLLSGSYDDVALPGAVTELARRWRATLRLYPHGHISMMMSPGAWSQARHFVATLLSG